MLFLLNDTIIEVAVPEMHVQQRWRDMGCGDPSGLRAQDAISFVSSQIAESQTSGRELDDEHVRDLAALIITKTGANSLILKPTVGGTVEPRLRDLPALVLETYQRGAANEGGQAAVRKKA